MEDSSGPENRLRIVQVGRKKEKVRYPPAKIITNTHQYHFLVVVTPAGMNVHTPPADNQGPPSRQDIWKVDADSSEHGGLPLSFNGKSAGDFSRMLRAANEFRHQNQLELAEETYREVLEGYGNLLFPTHETTVKLAFQLAGFYVEQGRPADADRIIEKMNYEFMKRWGPDHQKTRQHVMNIAELLNSWGREHDAYALLLHAKDIEEQRNSCLIEDIRSVENENTDTSRVEGFVEFASRKTPYQEVQSLRQCIQQDAGVDNIEYSLIVARSHESSEKSAVEELLIQIESSCSRKAQDLASQALRARAQRLELYRKQASTLEHNPEHVSAFSGTIGFVQLFWSLQRWDNAEFKSFEVLESSLEVAIVLLKSKRLNSAQTIFRAIEKKANCIFSYDDERTIWININIGLAYQTNMGWGHAEQWFDRALCGAHAAYNGNDGILRSLEKAKRNKRFEYVGDEGRPFKTVFGVSGLTIQPNRLHIT